jgi:hypothetical protein
MTIRLVDHCGLYGLSPSGVTTYNVGGNQKALLHLRVHRLGFLQDGDAGVSIVPACEATQRLQIPAQLISPEPARSGLHR